MSTQNNGCTCEGTVNATACLPIKVCIDKGEFGGLRTWESDWFSIAPSGNYVIEHDLHIDTPWTCMPRLAPGSKKPWGRGRKALLFFADGSNYNGAAANQELGWVFSISSDSALLRMGNYSTYCVFGNSGSYGNINKSDVECKLVISY